MSVEDYNKIDIISIDNDGNAVLTISDYLEWDPGNEHLLILQTKINMYLGAIEAENYIPNIQKQKTEIFVLG